MNYEERIIAFIDILGFTTQVKKSSHDDDILKDIYNIQKQINNIFLLNREEEREIGTEITQFSDSLIISINQDQWGGIFHTISDCSTVIHVLLNEGFLCKGVILKGSLIHERDICFGPALLEAIKIEGKESRPVIKIGKDLVEHAREYPGPAQQGYPDREMEDYIYPKLKSLDNQHYYINYLENFSDFAETPEDVYLYYEKVRSFVTYNLKHQIKTNVYKKFAWIKSRFNESGISESDYVGKINYEPNFFRKLVMFVRSAPNLLMSFVKKKVYLNKF